MLTRPTRDALGRVGSASTTSIMSLSVPMLPKLNESIYFLLNPCFDFHAFSVIVFVRFYRPCTAFRLARYSRNSFTCTSLLRVQRPSQTLLLMTRAVWRQGQFSTFWRRLRGPPFNEISSRCGIDQHSFYTNRRCGSADRTAPWQGGPIAATCYFERQFLSPSLPDCSRGL